MAPPAVFIGSVETRASCEVAGAALSAVARIVIGFVAFASDVISDLLLGRHSEVLTLSHSVAQCQGRKVRD